jgi:hypothetical protein
VNAKIQAPNRRDLLTWSTVERAYDTGVT